MFTWKLCCFPARGFRLRMIAALWQWKVVVDCTPFIPSFYSGDNPVSTQSLIGCMEPAAKNKKPVPLPSSVHPQLQLARLPAVPWNPCSTWSAHSSTWCWRAGWPSRPSGLQKNHPLDGTENIWMNGYQWVDLREIYRKPWDFCPQNIRFSCKCSLQPILGV